MDLEAELVGAYESIRRFVGVDYPKPRLVASDQEREKYQQENALRPAPAFMLCADDIGVVFVSPKRCSESEDGHRLYVWRHEMGHFLLCALNKELASPRRRQLQKSKVLVDRQKAWLGLAVQEGFAHYLAIQSCEGDETLRSFAQREHTALLWLFENRKSRLLEKLETTADWRQALIAHFNEAPEEAMYGKNEIGYQFFNQLQPTELPPIMAEPPRTFRELFAADEYKKRTGL